MKIQKCPNKNEILLKVFNNNIKTTVMKIVPSITFRKAHDNENGKTWKIEWRILHLWMNDVSDGCLAKGEGNYWKDFNVPGRSQTHDLRKVRPMELWNLSFQLFLYPLPGHRYTFSSLFQGQDLCATMSILVYCLNSEEKAVVCLVHMPVIHSWQRISKFSF